jgi:glycine/D-amino acid oxidase-like deaminating enzyme
VIDRRQLLKGAAVGAGSLALARSGGAATDAAPPTGARRRRIAVFGAGAFGSFTALALRDRGHEVTLVDPWGPGNARASSGGETRVIRGAYGADATYTRLAVAAFERWAAFEKRVGRTFLTPTGALWMVATEDDAFLRQAAPLLREAKLPTEELSAEEARRRWPQVRFDGVRWVLFEERAGFLLARRACAAAVEEFVRAGGVYRSLAVADGLDECLDDEAEVRSKATALSPIALSDGSQLTADEYVFACGPWLPRIFPSLLAQSLSPTRQDVFFFGPPEADRRFDQGSLPVWIEWGERLFYGIPGNESRGFKVADDTRGEPFDPTHGERRVTDENFARARALLERRFPALARAPLVESRVCQYENTPDHDFLLDRHPAWSNVWIVGGGSGHGFKFAPAWGEQVAATVVGERPIEAKFGLARLAQPRSTR